MDFASLATLGAGGMDLAGGVFSAFANANQASKNRSFQDYMSSTAYQRAVLDLERAGLNPMLAYGHGGASTPTGATAHIENPAKGVGATAASAAQAGLVTAQKEKLEAETAEIRARTEVHPATVTELGSRSSLQNAQWANVNANTQHLLADIDRIIATTDREWSTSAHAVQGVKNMQAVLPQIEAHTAQLRSLAALQSAQIPHVAAQIGLTTAETAEVVQRVKANLPYLEKLAMELANQAKLLTMPGRENDASAQSSFVGTLGAYFRALTGMSSFLGGVGAGAALRRPATVHRNTTIHNRR